MLLDLNSYESIRAFVDNFFARGLPLHVLLNNAAIQAPQHERGRIDAGWWSFIAVRTQRIRYSGVRAPVQRHHAHPARHDDTIMAGWEAHA